MSPNPDPHCRVRVKAYKVGPEDLLDLVDLAGLASHVEAKRCPGGRYVADGYRCQICGQDPSQVIERDGKRYRACGKARDKQLREDLSPLVRDAVLEVVG